MQIGQNHQYIKLLQDQKNQLEELLHCQICYSKAQDPILCPHCSKLYCRNCINKLLSFKSECANCRKVIKGQLTNCSRFVNEISNIVNTIVEIQKQEKLCGIHHISLNYFCVDCNRSACCECKMFGQHQDHQFKPIGIIYERKYDHIRELLSKLKTNIVSNQIVLKQVQSNMALIQQGCDTNISQIEQYEQKYKNTIMKEKGQQHENESDKQVLKKQLVQLEQIKQQIIKHAQKARRTHCYKLDINLMNRFEDLMKSSKQIININRNVPACTQAIPQYTKFSVIVHQYSTQKVRGKQFYSQKLFYEGSEWRLIICNKGINNNQYLSIFLELLKNPDEISNYEYSIEIINNKDRKKNVFKSYRANFVVNEWLGYDKLIKDSQLYSGDFISKQTDDLQIQLGIKLMSYYDLFKRRQLLIELLDKNIKQHDTIIENIEKENNCNDVNSFGYL